MSNPIKPIATKVAPVEHRPLTPPPEWQAHIDQGLQIASMLPEGDPDRLTILKSAGYLWSMLAGITVAAEQIAKDQ